LNIDPVRFSHFAAIRVYFSIHRVFKSIGKRFVKFPVTSLREIDAEISPGFWGVGFSAGCNKRECNRQKASQPKGVKGKWEKGKNQAV
jgi:hypothetical protein